METWSPPPCPNTGTVRRNPHRKARPTTSTKPPIPPSSSADRPEIAPFPIGDILSIQINQNPQTEPSSSSQQSSVSENLKVYLRIRPLLPLKGSPRSNAGDHNERSRNKNVWPQNLASKKKKNSAREKCTNKKIGEGCITVNDFQSVTLSPPPALQESKRIKSEVYQGFSHVFSADSSQDEVYEKMVSPLVKDFLEGKSGMLTALGPSGSGKTHTVFGSPREPGMVSLALQQIFRQTDRSNSNSRLFYISMFEICSERGKGERIFDLSPDGADLSMQRSTIKGLQEAIISDASHAESLIASAILKRTTAMTNTNSQSSRSQCIINIRSVVHKVDGEVDLQLNDAILTIVDLAGAEREKRTGNQRTRLLESNFINNTSMVFGLCLRSLLEHQKNPKKLLQKHFQNSLLTRYLRDYLEGKKRMALILTVRSGEEDYLDTSHVLRQASPYMKIKFDNVEEASNLQRNKRHFQISSRMEPLKRTKFCSDVSGIEEGASLKDKHPFAKEEAATIKKLDVTDSAPLELDCSAQEKSDRKHQIMQSFAKAAWNVLKEYRDKLKLAESEIQNLNGNLQNEKTKYLALEKELKDLKSFACMKENVADGNTVEVDARYVDKVNARTSPSTLKQIEHDKDEQEIHTTLFTLVAEECANKMTSGNKSIADKFDESKSFAAAHTFSTADVTGCAASSSSLVEMVNDNNCSTSNLPQLLNKEDKLAESEIQNPGENLQNEKTKYLELKDLKGCCACTKENVADGNIVKVDVQYVDEFNAQASPSSLKQIEHDKDEQEIQTTFFTLVAEESANMMSSGNKSNADKLDESKSLAVAHTFSTEDVTGCAASSSSLIEMVNDNSHSTSKLPQLLNKEDKEPPELSVAHEKDVLTQESNIFHEPTSQPIPDTSCKSLKLEKPKRRLLPASSILLRDISALDVADETDNSRGNRGGKKLIAGETKRTQGNISLLRLLKSNVHLTK